MSITDERKAPSGTGRSAPASSRSTPKKQAAKKAVRARAPATVRIASKKAAPHGSARKVTYGDVSRIVGERGGRRVSSRQFAPDLLQSITAVDLLGVDRDEYGDDLTPREWVDVVRRGVHPDAMNTISHFLLLSNAELSAAIDIPLRTLMRRKGEEVLPRDETAKLVRVARVIERAEEVFDDQDAARDWLKAPNAALGGDTPMSMLDTEVGAEAVLETLGRIEHGVFA